jgi:hypothetical protein
MGLSTQQRVKVTQGLMGYEQRQVERSEKRTKYFQEYNGKADTGRKFRRYHKWTTLRVKMPLINV